MLATTTQYVGTLKHDHLNCVKQGHLKTVAPSQGCAEGKDEERAGNARGRREGE